jgi:ferritin-like metal-binding protein YciE
MTIDERLQFLVQSTESLHASLEKHIEETNAQIGALTRRAEAHEREQQRFRRAMRAALEAWLSDNGDEPQENGPD